MFKTREKLTVDRFIKKSIEKHGDKFDYRLIKCIKNNRAKVVIICNVCGGPFIQAPDKHMSGDGCYYCSGKYQRNTLGFIKDAIQVHGFSFDYSLVNYTKMNNKVTLIHNKCGHKFDTKALNHIVNKSGCPKCNGGISFSKEDFIKKCKSIHGDKYNYEKVEYVNSLCGVNIYCKSCKCYFKQKAGAHSIGVGCPKCCESKGEREISRFLTDNNIDFVRQYSPKGCINIKQLYFDFYLPSSKTAIEFNGAQHYRPVDHFGGVKAFKSTIKRDQAKSKWCSSNNIKLYIIKYNDDLNSKLKILINGENNGIH